MNKIQKHPISELGFGFIEKANLPLDKGEYYLRDSKWKNETVYRSLSSSEIEILVRNDNTADHWDNIKVSEGFNPSLVKNSHFYGLVRIGRTDSCYLEFHDYRQPVGIYNSTIISCDIGDNVVINHVNYLSHYQIEDEVIITNVAEMSTTSYAKFGNGIVKEGEPESVRIWMELCNENGGRSVLPFDGMLPADAYLWSRFRDDKELMNAFVNLTAKKFDQHRGYYGRVGTRSVIKNCSIIKDVLIGTDAYLKGATKIKNVTINSSAEASTQIGEGCELVNGIIGFGCRVFYGVKAVRFVLSSHSTLKYGARLINSFLGYNSTVSCCEVLNSLIYSSHEQHHNDSFLCASMVAGQSNIAAGATIGSNHNSRSPDGELIAGRGFWPGLSVSLRHNSRFASFTLLSKGTYVYELDQPFPFALILNDEHDDSLKIMPAYWFQYNMYALARNAWKYQQRDQRIDKTLTIEYDYLAPDTVNEMMDSMAHLCLAVGTSKALSKNEKVSTVEALFSGKTILENNESIGFPVYASRIENSKRKTIILKADKAYQIFKRMISFYYAKTVIESFEINLLKNHDELINAVSYSFREKWINVGGQLLRENSVCELKDYVKNGRISSWDELHDFYRKCNDNYALDKLKHAIASLKECFSIDQLDTETVMKHLDDSIETFKWISDGIKKSREKDYINPFRKMVYENEEEMNIVLGSLESNSFIKETEIAFELYKEKVELVSQFLLANSEVAL